MTPEQIDRVFGRGRLKMATGDHVEVFREAVARSERRRYTKRFLNTNDGDFAHWTEREWRILARLIGHGIDCVPDVVQFDRGSIAGTQMVQTYDAGVTVDQWATLLPLTRNGRVYRHAFEDCAHWWALAHHSLIALKKIHQLQLVHLDVKGDNVCIPLGPANFDPDTPGARLYPVFGELALIDFAFALVSGESLTHPLPIGWQREYDYQSPRLLKALEEGRNGDLRPTRLLDWRCDMYSLAAMLKRYLPDESAVRDVKATGWSAERYDAAKALILALRAHHDRDGAQAHPHSALLNATSARLHEDELAASLASGWTLARDVDVVPANPSPLTPMTRLAPSIRVFLSPPTVIVTNTESVLPKRDTVVPLVIPPRDETAATTARRARSRASIAAPVVFVVAAGALAAALFPQQSRAIADQFATWARGLWPAPHTTASVGEPQKLAAEADSPKPAAQAEPPKLAPQPEVAPPIAAPIPAPSQQAAAPPEPAVSKPVASAATDATRTPQTPLQKRTIAAAPKSTPTPKVKIAKIPAAPAPSTQLAKSAAAAKAASQRALAAAATNRLVAMSTHRPSPTTAVAPVAASAPPLPVDQRTASQAAPTSAAAANATPTTPAANPPSQVASAQIAEEPTSPPSQPPSRAQRSERSSDKSWLSKLFAFAARKPAPIEDRRLAAAVPKNSTAESSPAPSTQPLAQADPPRVVQPTPPENDAQPPRDTPRGVQLPARIPSPYAVAHAALEADFARDDGFASEGRRALRQVVPRVAAQAQSEVARVLWIAANADDSSQERHVIDAAQSIWIAEEGASVTPTTAPMEARRLHDEALDAYRSRRNMSEAFDLQLRAFGANPYDAEIAGNLAMLHLKPTRLQPETARQLALVALAYRSERWRSGRFEDWNTYAIASALTGRVADARNALFVTVALSRNVERSCRAALGALSNYGERMREPVEAMFQRIHAQGRAYESPYCAWPPRLAMAPRMQ